MNDHKSNDRRVFVSLDIKRTHSVPMPADSAVLVPCAARRGHGPRQCAVGVAGRVRCAAAACVATCPCPFARVTQAMYNAVRSYANYQNGSIARTIKNTLKKVQ